MCCEERFSQQLRARGFRLAPQREMVLHDAEEHATVEELYVRVRELSSAVDLSTIYRTLDILEDFHLAASFDLGDGQRRYELLTLHAPHHHLHCLYNGLLVTSGLGQRRAEGVEPPRVASGEDLSFVVPLVGRHGLDCAVGDAIAYLQGER